MPKVLRIKIDLEVPVSEDPMAMAEKIIETEARVVNFKTAFGEGVTAEHTTNVVTPRPREKKPKEPGALLKLMTGETQEQPAPQAPDQQEQAGEPAPNPLDIPAFLRRPLPQSG